MLRLSPRSRTAASRRTSFDQGRRLWRLYQPGERTVKFQGKTLTLCTLLTAAGTGALAAPVQWSVAVGGNDHWYEFNQGTSGGIVWRVVRVVPLASPPPGTQSHLATLTSAAEQAFLLGLSPDGWLGGSDEAIEGEWRWMDGPEAGTLFWTGGVGGVASGFTSWNSANGGEPNNNSNEDYVHLNGGNWNDFSGSQTRGYFIEYSAAPPPPNGVPLPGTLSMAALGLGALCLTRRRRHGLVGPQSTQ
jgi:MYXO-CTERM domain-containing protein